MKNIVLNLFLFLFIIKVSHAQNNNAKKKYIIKDSVQIAMPDGGNVCAFVSAGNTPENVKQPCILIYNIYADNIDTSDYKYFKKAIDDEGYATIIVNTRGKRCSTSNIEPLEHDADDAYYIIDWISKQSWCNGKIGMYGGSYLGFAQWAATKHLHPALKTIIPQVSVGAGIDFPMQNGVFMSYMLQWIHFVTDNKLTNTESFSDTTKWNSLFNSTYKKGLRFSSLDSLEGHRNTTFQRWLSHPTYDAYWKKMTPQAKEFSKINIPILTITGYWDDDQLGAMHYYNQHHLYNKNANHYLLIGPYDHYGAQGGISDTLLGYRIDSVAKLKINNLCMKWFDYVLKDSLRPAILKDKVNFEIAGINEWRHVANLNQMSNATLQLYLNNHKLENKKNASVQYIAQTIDFKDRSIIKPVGQDIMAFPSIVTNTLNPLPEQLMFLSDAVDGNFALCGNFEANLVFSCNKKDVDVVIDLYELLPNGQYVALSENIQRASLAKDKSRRQLLKPNTMQNLKMSNTFITCKQLQKGSKLLVLLGINKNPNWQINYGTGKDVSQEDITDATEPLKIKWYNTSFINFKILE